MIFRSVWITNQEFIDDITRILNAEEIPVKERDDLGFNMTIDGYKVHIRTATCGEDNLRVSAPYYDPARAVFLIWMTGYIRDKLLDCTAQFDDGHAEFDIKAGSSGLHKEKRTCP